MPSDASPTKRNTCRILSLDGGGAKGFYTLGALREVEALLGGRPLYEQFDLVFGTSTGAIIAALICLRKKADEIYEIYKENVPRVVAQTSSKAKSAALAQLAEEVFGDLKFDAFKTGIGIVATRWLTERPMIFKANIAQAHGRQATFSPGFGCTISDAVQASCSAYPFFKRKTVVTDADHHIELIDGGFCANNPTLYALADALEALKVPRQDVRVLSIGVGTYPARKKKITSGAYWYEKLPSVKLAQKIFEINTQSLDQLRHILFEDVRTVRINDAFEQPEMATDLFESDIKKLNILRQRGVESYAKYEADLKNLFA